MPRRKQPEETPQDTDLFSFAATEGVHLHLPDHAYFDVDALGSTDLKILLRDPASWYYSSRRNEHRRARDARRSEALALGAALHCLLLEGEAAYEERFAVEPDETEHKDKAHTATQIHDLLESRGVATGGTYQKAKLIALAKKHGLGDQVWGVIWQRFESKAADGAIKITRDEDLRLRHMAALAENHEDLGAGLKLGFSEVSVFWRRRDDNDEPVGPLLRARFDKLAPGFILDLKTIGNWKGRSPREAAIASIREHEYDVQRRLYDEAFTALVRAVSKRRVWSWAGGAAARPLAAQTRKLEEIAARRPAWIWLFYQVVCHDKGSERAPVILPFRHDASGQVWDQAGIKVETALANFAAFEERYGETTPWAVIEKIQDLSDADLSSLMFKGLPQ